MPAVIQARCPRCNQTLSFPRDPNVARVRCEHCGATIRINARKRAASQSVETKKDAVPTPVVAGAATELEPLITLRNHARGRLWKWQAVAATVFLLAAACVYWKWDALKRYGEEYFAVVVDATQVGVEAPKISPNRVNAPDPVRSEAAEPVFPRRLLAISVNNYLYANPVDVGLREGKDNAQGDRRIHTVANKLAAALHIPEAQVAVLSDSAPEGTATAPLKTVIEETILEFARSSRTQDHIVLMFIGHAVEIDDDAYLVPIEGELRVKETLVPLKWVYERLRECPAQQKILIADVCRFNPSRGLERPGSGPMGPILDAALQNPPRGVEVWSSCVAWQYSYEGPLTLASDITVVGGFFITELAEAVGAFQRKIPIGTQRLGDLLPIDSIANGDGKEIEIGGERVPRGVNSLAKHHAREWYGAAQTPRLSGEAAVASGRRDPEEPPAKQLVIQTLKPAGDIAAEPEVVQQILNDTETKMARDGALHLTVTALPPFSATLLADYADDAEMTPFREEIIRAANLAKKHAKVFQEEFRGSAAADAIKKDVLKRQHGPARAMAELMGQLETLKELEPEKGNETSKRWRANYDYVVAKLHAHLAYVYEYNYMLGQIRKDALPVRDPKKHGGWRLAASQTLQSGAEGKKLASEAKKRLDALAKEHKDTPWEIMAKRQSLTALGLEWQPCP